MREVLVYGIPKSVLFTTNLAQYLGVLIGEVRFQTFSDGEHEVEILDNPRGKNVVVVGSTNPPADNFEYLSLLCHTAWNMGAHSIICAVPYFGYSRQDSPKRPGQSVGMSVRGRMFSSLPIDWLLLMDLHNLVTVSVFQGLRRSVLSASEVFLPKMRELGLENSVVASPDVGRLNIVRDTYARELKVPAVSGDKHRVEGGLEYFGVLGEVRDKTVYLIDDIVDTGGTLISAAKALLEGGAREIEGFVTHGVLSGNAESDLISSPIKNIYLTDTIDEGRSLDPSYFRKISAVPIFAKRIKELLL